MFGLGEIRRKLSWHCWLLFSVMHSHWIYFSEAQTRKIEFHLCGCSEADLADKVTLLSKPWLSKPFIGNLFRAHIELFLRCRCKIHLPFTNLPLFIRPTSLKLTLHHPMSKIPKQMPIARWTCTQLKGMGAKSCFCEGKDTYRGQN